ATPTADQSAELHQFFRTHGPLVRQWARRFARASCDADDIAQDVFLVVQRHAELVWSLENPRAWLVRATFNVARHYWRRQARQLLRELAWKRAAPQWAGIDPVADLEAREVARRIGEVVATLDARSAEIYRLAAVERLSNAAISIMTGLSPVTVRVRRFRARAVIARRCAALLRASDATVGH
ncbi:MAG TPA: sigma-70 family RNA polymerase sigma factor, partial [Polyangia bacterium]|nr:sigma-70 family RNA polymerase sigma factor [Polyangia bacterium]